MLAGHVCCLIRCFHSTIRQQYPHLSSHCDERWQLDRLCRNVYHTDILVKVHGKGATEGLLKIHLNFINCKTISLVTNLEFRAWEVLRRKKGLAGGRIARSHITR